MYSTGGFSVGDIDVLFVSAFSVTGLACCGFFWFVGVDGD